MKRQLSLKLENGPGFTPIERRDLSVWVSSSVFRWAFLFGSVGVVNGVINGRDWRYTLKVDSWPWIVVYLTLAHIAHLTRLGLNDCYDSSC